MGNKRRPSNTAAPLSNAKSAPTNAKDVIQYVTFASCEQISINSTAVLISLLSANIAFNQKNTSRSLRL
jgi:hypothetical protein